MNITQIIPGSGEWYSMQAEVRRELQALQVFGKAQLCHQWQCCHH